MQDESDDILGKLLNQLDTYMLLNFSPSCYQGKGKVLRNRLFAKYHEFKEPFNKLAYDHKLTRYKPICYYGPEDIAGGIISSEVDEENPVASASDPVSNSGKEEA